MLRNHHYGDALIDAGRKELVDLLNVKRRIPRATCLASARFTMSSGMLRRLSRALWVLTIMVSCQLATRAQNVQHTNQTMDMGVRSDLRVNPASRAVEIQIPLGNYPGRAGHDIPVALSWSSKVWNMDFQGYNPGQYNSNGQPIGNGYTMLAARYAEHSVAGWTSTIGFPVIDTRPTAVLYDVGGYPKSNGNCGSPCYFVDRITVWMPDGSAHELRSGDQPLTYTDQPRDDLYSVDGSRMRYQRSTQTLFLPNGSRYVLSSSPAYIDRNGNTITSTDTLGRTVGNPLVAYGFAPSGPLDQDYSLPGVGGGPSINYTLKWRPLAGVLTTPQSPAYYGDTRCPVGNGSYSPHLFTSDGGSSTCIVNADGVFNPVVLNQIVLPTGQAYTFTYNIYGEIDKIELPTGGYERYVYDYVTPFSYTSFVYSQVNRGVVTRFVSPTGSAADEVQWTYSGTGAGVSVTAPDGTRTERFQWGDANSNWGFSIDGARAGRAYDERVYSASGQMLRRKLTDWTATPSNSNAVANPQSQFANRNSRVAREVDFILDTGGAALAKSTTYGYDTTYQYNVGIDQTSISEYDYVAVDQNTAQTIDISSMSQIPNGTLLRTTQTSYLTSDASYVNNVRHLVGLPSSITVYKGSPADNIVAAQTFINYDEGGQFAQLNDYSTVVNWTDPQTSYRGNATTTRRWLNTTGAYLQTHAQYDQCGSLRKSWDARDTTLTNPAQISYTDSFFDGTPRNTYAYPTSITTAVPDSSGQSGSTSGFTTSTKYDFNTGLTMSATDANNVTTNFEYNDPLNRLKRTVRAYGTAIQSQSSISYDDVNRIITSTSDQNTYNDGLLKSEVVFDALGRTVEKRQFEGGTSYIAARTQYDAMGRAFKVSNPFRPLSETPVWTTSEFDSLGRVKSVTTPDNAVVNTYYNGNQVLVKDQAGKERMSQTNALGQLKDVWEIIAPDTGTEVVSFPDHSEVTAGYHTGYSYNVLDDLTTVNQGNQTRTFVYDSLKRLTSATNPESGLVSYQYDENGNLKQKTDARLLADNSTHVTVTYDYDALNRIKTRTYNDGTPAVTYIYDPNIANGKGRLASVNSSVSSYSYGEYDSLGKIKTGTQTTDGNVYTMTYVYDLAGDLTSQTYPSGRVVTNSFDVAGRLNSVTGQKPSEADKTYESSFTYTAHGAVAAAQLGNGLWEHTNFNSRLQIWEIGLGTAQGGIDRLKLSYDYGTTNNNGNLQSQVNTVPGGPALTQSYVYDQLNRLQSAQEMNGGSQTWQQAFTYADQNGQNGRFGNRRIDAANTTVSLISENPQFDPTTNRIQAQTGEQYAYDPAGNLIKDKTGNTFVYDAENKQTIYDGGNPANGGASYAYDGNGQRVKKISSSGTTIFVYDALGKLVAEYSDTPATGGTSYLTADILGTPRVITDKNGSVIGRHDYLPFGEELFAGTGGRTTAQGYSASDGVRQHFADKERDNETGLDYFINRYYSSTQGRFTSVDPIKLTSGRLLQPQRLNLYSYTINNPLNLIDPDGKDIDFVNDTKEGRRKALLSITANMTAREARNVGARYNKDTHKYEGFVKDASKIDMSKASQGYQDFSDRVNNHDLKLNYAYLGKNDSATIELNGVTTKLTQKSLAGAGGESTGFVAPQSDGSFAVIVSAAGYPAGVAGLTASGRETPIAMPNFIMAAHELFAETYKYTPEGRRQGLDREENFVDDSNKVIEIENKYRDFHGLPHRSGTDHGYVHAPTVTVRP